MPSKSTQAQQLEPVEPATREPGDEPDRESLPPQRGWKHDNGAGVERLLYNDGDNKRYEFWLKFRDGKPSDAVRAYMKDNGFRWQPDAPTGGRWPEVKGAWARPVGYETRSQDRLHGERVFDKVVEMICAEKGIAPPEKTGGTPF